MLYYFEYFESHGPTEMLWFKYQNGINIHIYNTATQPGARFYTNNYYEKWDIDRRTRFWKIQE